MDTWITCTFWLLWCYEHLCTTISVSVLNSFGGSYNRSRIAEPSIAKNYLAPNVSKTKKLWFMISSNVQKFQPLLFTFFFCLLFLFMEFQLYLYLFGLLCSVLHFYVSFPVSSCSLTCFYAMSNCLVFPMYFSFKY